MPYVNAPLLLVPLLTLVEKQGIPVNNQFCSLPQLSKHSTYKHQFYHTPYSSLRYYTLCMSEREARKDLSRPATRSNYMATPAGDQFRDLTVTFRTARRRSARQQPSSNI